MTLGIAGYKGQGTWIDAVTRTALSIRHRTSVPYSHVELLPHPPIPLSATSETLVQRSLAASKRDGNKVRFKKDLIFKKGNWDFVDLRVSNDEAHRIWSEAISLIDTPYDMWGAALCITPLARLSLDKEWCSGLIADIADWPNPEFYDPYMVMKKAITLGGELVVG